MDLQNVKHYHQKLSGHLQQSIIECNNDPREFASKVEDFFQDNLLRKYNQQ